MKLLLQREKDYISKLFIDDKYQCLILENPNTAIPAATYEVLLQYSPRFKRYNLRLMVPGRGGIEVHTGNLYINSTGCLITGKTKDAVKKSVGASIPAYNALLRKIEKYIFLDPMATYEPIMITILPHKGDC